MGRFVTIGWFMDPVQAHVARTALEAHGIPAFLLDEATAHTYGSDVVPVRLVVAAEDEVRARKVLAEDSPGTGLIPSGRLVTHDGVPLFARAWPVEGRRWVGIVHGYGEHCGRYDAFARWLNARGWGVAACDLRGHGGSPGRRGHIRRFSEYLADVAALHGFLRERAAGAPVFLLGHSLGGLVALRYAQEGTPGLAGLILSAPFLAMAMPVPRWKTTLSPLLSVVWPSFSTPSGLRGTMISRDREAVAAYEADPLVHRTATARWFSEVRQAQEKALAHARGLSLPLLVLQGDADPIASVAATRQFFAAAASADKALQLYRGYLHEVLNEQGKERVWEDAASWLDDHVCPGPRGGPP